MTSASDQATQYGFLPLAIARIKGAQRANQIAIYMLYAAMIAFVVFGTIASIKMFHGNTLLYRLYFNLPYVLIALTIPITLYDALVIYRYRLSQSSMVIMAIGVSTLILIGGLIFADTAWLGLSCWLGVAFLFKSNFKRFFDFLAAEDALETTGDSLDTPVKSPADSNP